MCSRNDTAERRRIYHGRQINETIIGSDEFQPLPSASNNASEPTVLLRVNRRRDRSDVIVSLERSTLMSLRPTVGLYERRRTASVSVTLFADLIKLCCFGFISVFSTLVVFWMEIHLIIISRWTESTLFCNRTQEDNKSTNDSIDWTSTEEELIPWLPTYFQSPRFKHLLQTLCVTDVVRCMRPISKSTPFVTRRSNDICHMWLTWASQARRTSR